MAIPIDRNILTLPVGFRSREAAVLAAALDDQLGLLTHDLEGITPEELAWQPAPGMNTIGMLLAHLAIVEVLWIQVGPEGRPIDVRPVLGLELDDDGMPMPAGATPPAVLDGRDLPFYLDLLARARAYYKRVAAALTDADLDLVRDRVRRDGKPQANSIRWVLYHVLEHFSGHYGQILLLRHQYRDARAVAR